MRLFRIIAFSARLNKLVRIDNIVFRKFHKYRDVLMEEISDRVVVNVLNDMQTELQTGTPLFKRVIQEVIRPKRQALTELLVDKLRTVARDMNDIFDQEMRIYIEGCIRKALTSSEDIRLLKMIPGAGKMITRRVENMATDIAFHTVDKIFRDIHAPEKDDLFFDAVFFQQFLNVHNRHVTGHNIEEMESGGKIRLIAGLDAERLFCPGY